MWPIGSRDFLIVTSEEIVNSATGQGFILCSKSIDDICEDIEETSEGEEEEEVKAPSPVHVRDAESEEWSDRESRYRGRLRETSTGFIKTMGSVQWLHKNSTSSLSLLSGRDSPAQQQTSFLKKPASSVPNMNLLIKEEHFSTPLPKERSESSRDASVDGSSEKGDTNLSPTLGGKETGLSNPNSKYTRSTLRLAGYAGVPSATIPGATDLYLFVDVDVYEYIPAWLLKVLAQHGLSEIMRRIQSICAPLPKPVSSITTGTGTGKGSSSRQSTSPVMTPDTKSPVTISDHASAAAAAAVTSASKASSSSSSSSSSFTPIHDSPMTGTSSESPTSPSPTIPLDMSEIAIRKAHAYLDLPYLAPGATSSESVSMGLSYTLKVDKQNITVKTAPVDGSNYFALRAVSRIVGSKSAIRDLLMDDNSVSEYDDMFDFMTFLRKESGCSIRRVCCKGVWPTAPRDFILATTCKELSDGRILVASYTPDNPSSYAGDAKGYVRGTVHVSGYLITQVSETECDIELCSHIDLGGNVPTTLINMLGVSAPPKILAAVANVIRQRSAHT